MFVVKYIGFVTAVSGLRMCRDQATAVPRGFEGPSGGMQIDARSLGRGVRSVGATFQAYIKTTEWDAGTLSARNKVWWPAAIFGATSTRTPSSSVPCHAGVRTRKEAWPRCRVTGIDRPGIADVMPSVATEQSVNNAAAGMA